jgi:hypothetical protein
LWTFLVGTDFGCFALAVLPVMKYQKCRGRKGQNIKALAAPAVPGLLRWKIEINVVSLVGQIYNQEKAI